ncbi:hypothetical protein SAMN05443428_106122 [Caloramator quimbayensis]|uniref:Uncharacterized protein n=1 Tax=Caloramator quimbayensis TaxID=1147123 RepID=A0A1T4X7S0_9CLOT|nr:DUF6762 family protein [Caloramator quimbayensis]SKA85158.1 hypothetical protein SAMN05443428_106122 [Caloramator quimbayensis]
MEGSSIVLMEKQDGILSKELGSYEIETGIEYIYKAYVEDEIVYLFLTTNVDVDDENYNDIFDEYDFEGHINLGCQVEEVEEEYNPVWLIKTDFINQHDDMKKKLNDIIKYHAEEIKRIYEKLGINPL